MTINKRLISTVKENMPFGGWIAFWYKTCCKPQLSYRTRVGYEDRIYKHIILELGQIPLNKLSQNDLKQFYTMQKQAAVKIDHQIGKTDVPMPQAEQRAPHADQRSFQPYQPKYRKPGTGCVYQTNDHLWEGKYSKSNSRTSQKLRCYKQRKPAGMKTPAGNVLGLGRNRRQVA